VHPASDPVPPDQYEVEFASASLSDRHLFDCRQKMEKMEKFLDTFWELFNDDASLPCDAERCEDAHRS
jgi:hypothetical protein